MATPERVLDVMGELGGVGADAVQEARVPATHEVEAERVQARLRRDAALVPELAPVVQDRDVEPRVLAAIPGRPHDGADAGRPEIETAWVIQVTFADQPQLPRPVVGIEAARTGTDWPSLMRAIEAAAEKSVPGELFDIQPVDRRNPTGFTGSLLQVEPFYRRAAAVPAFN